jgi:ribosomal protein L35AE/L33A
VKRRMESNSELDARAEVSSSRVGQSRVHKRRMIIELSSIHARSEAYIESPKQTDTIAGGKSECGRDME